MNSSTQADRRIRRDALRALLVCALSIGAPVAGYGLLLVGIDLSSQGEDWDGLGILFGSMLAAPALLVSGLAWAGLRGTSRRPENGGRAVAVALGLLLVLPILLAPGTSLLLLPTVVGIGLVGVAVLGGRSVGQS